jgi:hypothetical protein
MCVIIGSVVWMLTVGLISWTESCSVRLTTMLVLSLAIGGLVWVATSQ